MIVRFFHLLRLDECGLCVRSEVLDHSLGDQGKCTDDTNWKQHIKCCAGEINPEIAKGLCFTPCNTPDESDCECNAGGRRNEIVEGQPCHLNEIAHGGLTGVGLPVRIGREAGGRIECQVRRHAGELLRIERQIILEPLKSVEDKQTCQAEHQHGGSVGCPVLLLVLVNAAYPIDQSLYRAEHPAQKRPLSGKYLGHVDPEWLGYGKQNQKVYSELQKSVKCHLIFSLNDYSERHK